MKQGTRWPVHWDDPEGWDGEGGEREGQDWGPVHVHVHVYLWLIHINIWQKPPQYRKVISLQVNK